MKEEILKLLNDNATTVKIGSDGDYMVEKALLQDDFSYMTEKIVEILRRI